MNLEERKNQKDDKEEERKQKEEESVFAEPEEQIQGPKSWKAVGSYLLFKTEKGRMLC